ncbi:hypothetical protein NL676_010049 [Syzygium grande]|nr:hypothetical protein NL676_010049 [Syzygium grande]
MESIVSFNWKLKDRGRLSFGWLSRKADNGAATRSPSFHRHNIERLFPPFRSPLPPNLPPSSDSSPPAPPTLLLPPAPIAAAGRPPPSPATSSAKSHPVGKRSSLFCAPTSLFFFPRVWLRDESRGS